MKRKSGNGDCVEARALFNTIADSWYNVHHYSRFSTELRELAEKWKNGTLLNVGCGHGADFLPFAEHGNFELHGIDIAEEMVEQCERFQEKHNFNANVRQGDMGDLPFENERFDHVICVAALHHLKKKEDRVQALQEMHRVLTAEGNLFLTVLNRRYPRFWFRGEETTLSWNHEGETLERYYYLYTRRKLKRDLRAAGFTVLKLTGEKDAKIRYFARNILAEAQT